MQRAVRKPPAARKATIPGTVIVALLVGCCGMEDVVIPAYEGMNALELHCWYVDVHGYDFRRFTPDAEGNPRIFYKNCRSGEELLVTIKEYKYG